MPGSILFVVSYVLLAVFVVAFLVRTFRMAKQPVHLRWELAPGQAIEVRPGFLGAYCGDLDDAGNRLRRWLLRYGLTWRRRVLEKFTLHSKADLRLLLLDLGVRWWEGDTHSQ